MTVAMVTWRILLLQEEKYLKYVDGLNHMLDRYHKVLRCLDNAEVRRRHCAMIVLQHACGSITLSMLFTTVRLNKFVQ